MHALYKYNKKENKIMTEGLTASDVALISGNNKSNDGLFGDGNGSWFIIILFLFAFLGWGGNGYGNAVGQTSSVYEGYVLANDFSQLSSQLSDSTNMLERRTDNINNGICSLGYDSLAQTNSVNTNILTSANALQGAIKDCCCQTQQSIADVKYTIGSTGCEISREIERGFADTNYNIATQSNTIDRRIADGFCHTNFNAERNTRSIVDSQTANTQAILAKLDAMENSRKDEKIAEQACIINNQYLLSQINRTPVPAYQVPNPYCNCNCNNGCC